jgi:hypothetical protein
MFVMLFLHVRVKRETQDILFSLIKGLFFQEGPPASTYWRLYVSSVRTRVGSSPNSRYPVRVGGTLVCTHRACMSTHLDRTIFRFFLGIDPRLTLRAPNGRVTAGTGAQSVRPVDSRACVLSVTHTQLFHLPFSLPPLVLSEERTERVPQELTDENDGTGPCRCHTGMCVCVSSLSLSAEARTPDTYMHTAILPSRSWLAA